MSLNDIIMGVSVHRKEKDLPISRGCINSEVHISSLIFFNLLQN